MVYCEVRKQSDSAIYLSIILWSYFIKNPIIKISSTTKRKSISENLFPITTVMIPPIIKSIEFTNTSNLTKLILSFNMITLNQYLNNIKIQFH